MQGPIASKPIVLSNEEWMNSLRSERSWSQRRSGLGSPWGGWGGDEAPAQRQSTGTYRTVCVRLCDGYFFPISYSTTRDRFGIDEDTCQSRCPSGAKLYVYRNPGQEADDMVDLAGQPYSKLRTAFLYRTSYDASCKCKAHPWEQEARQQHRIYALQVERRKGSRTATAELKSLEAAVASAGAQSRPRNETRRQSSRQAAPMVGPAPQIVGAPPPVVLSTETIEQGRGKASKGNRTADRQKALPAPMGLGAANAAPRRDEWQRKAFQSN